MLPLRLLPSAAACCVLAAWAARWAPPPTATPPASSARSASRVRPDGPARGRSSCQGGACAWGGGGGGRRRTRTRTRPACAGSPTHATAAPPTAPPKQALHSASGPASTAGQWTPTASAAAAACRAPTARWCAPGPGAAATRWGGPRCAALRCSCLGCTCACAGRFRVGLRWAGLHAALHAAPGQAGWARLLAEQLGQAARRARSAAARRWAPRAACAATAARPASTLEPMPRRRPPADACRSPSRAGPAISLPLLVSRSPSRPGAPRPWYRSLPTLSNLLAPFFACHGTFLASGCSASEMPEPDARKLMGRLLGERPGGRSVGRAGARRESAPRAPAALRPPATDGLAPPEMGLVLQAAQASQERLA